MHTTTFDAFQFIPYYLNSCGSALDYVNVYLTIRKCLSLKLNFHPCLAELFWSPSRGSITSNFCDGLSSLACVTYFLAQEAQGVLYMRACMCANACMSSGARAMGGLSTKIKAAKTYLHFGSACEFSCLRPSRRSPLRLSRNELSSTTAFGMFAGGTCKKRAECWCKGVLNGFTYTLLPLR